MWSGTAFFLLNVGVYWKNQSQKLGINCGMLVVVVG